MLRWLLIAVAATLAPSTASSVTVAGFGDSLTAGGDYLEYLPPEWNTIDLGKPGETSRLGKDRFMGLAPQLEADVLILLMGTNDVRFENFSVGVTVANLSAMVGTALEEGLTVVLAAPPVITAHSTKHSTSQADLFNERLAELADRLAEEAGAREIPFVDLFGAFSDLDDPAPYFMDGVHPNLLGRQVMAREIEDAVRLTQVPEPGTLLLVAGGLVLLAVPRPRR